MQSGRPRMSLAVAGVVGALAGLAGEGAAQVFPGALWSSPTEAAMAAGDLDGDGRMDTVVAFPNLLRVHLGDASGGPGPFTAYAAPSSNELALGDVDGDGDADVVLSTGEGGFALVVFRNDGAGALAAPTFVPVSGPMPDFVLGDFNEDGFADVAAGSIACTCLRLLAGDGSGGFLPQVEVPAAIAVNRLAVADLDRDRHLDLVVGSSGSASHVLQVLLGDGAGGFTGDPLVPVDSPGPNDLAIGDLDGDGDVDVASANGLDTSPPATVSIRFGDGAGGLLPGPDLPVGTYAWRVQLGDMGRDGDLDVFVLDALKDVVHVLVNDGSGGFTEAALVQTPHHPEDFVVGRFDADDRPDLLVGNKGFGGLCVERGLPDDAFEAPGRYATGLFSAGIAVADFDDDGHQDVVTGCTIVAGQLSVLLGDGAGALGAPQLLPAGDSCLRVATGDLDEDGAADIVTFDRSAKTVLLYRGDGGGAFGAPASTPTGIVASDLGVADVDGDGHLDVVVSPAIGALLAVVVLRGDGAGGFSGSLTTSVGVDVSDIELADVNADGRPDVAAAWAGGVKLLLGNGAGLFAVTDHATGAVPLSLAIADVDLDGHRDLLTGDASGTLTVLLGDGAGGFGDAASFTVGNNSSAWALAVADVTGDGLPDAIVARSQQDRLFVMPGDGTGAFATDSACFAATQPRAIAVADLDEDGRPDVLSMGFGNAVNVLPGRALPFAWKGLGHGLAGSLGIPSFAGTGTLAAGEPVKLVLAGARPSAPAWLVIGSQQLGLPFKGGTLVPYPAIVLAGAVGSAGTLSLQGPMPPGTPPGFTRLFQWWVADPAGPANAAASNALSATTAP